MLNIRTAMAESLPMTISPAPRVDRCLPLLVALVLALPLAHARGELPPSRQVVATGDVVPRHGAIGYPGGTPLAIDALGRALVVADAVDGTRALLWADGHEPELIWHERPAAATAEIDVASALASPDGRLVLALGGPLVELPPASERSELRQLRPVAATRLGAGGATLDGFTIDAMESIAAVSDDGTVVFTAGVHPTDAPPDRFSAVLLLDADGVHTIAGNSSALPEERRFVNLRPLGRSATGAVFFSGAHLLDSGREDGVFRWLGGAITAVVRSGDAASDGTVLDVRGGYGSSSTGEVLFRACAQGAGGCAVYRTDDGAVVKVRPVSSSESVHAGALNARGDIALVGVRAGTQPTVWLLRAGAAEAVEIRAREDAPALLNEHGATAWLSNAGLERRDGDRTDLLLGAGAHLDDGTALLSGGIEHTCLADDGRVGLVARVVDGSSQWVCADADGIHALDAPQAVDPGTPLPACAFAGADLVLLRNGIVERHTNAGIRTVLRPGDRPAGLTQPIDYIAEIRTNARGTILARVQAGTEELVRVDVRGRATRVDPRPPDAEGPLGVLDFGLTPDDDSVALIYLEEAPGERLAILIVRVDRDGSQELWRNDPALRLSAALFRDDIAVVQQVDDEADVARLSRIDLRSGAVEPLLSELSDRDLSLESLRGDGDLLLSEFLSDSGVQQRWLYENDVLTLLTETHLPNTGALLPVALGDGGHMLLTRFVGVWRGDSTVALAGPPVSARCPAAASASGSDDDGCQVGGAAGASAWPLLIAAALFAMRRRRGG